MTRASHARIAKRAAAHEAEAFKLPPAGMLSEQIDLEPYGLSIGIIHPEGMPLMVAVWDGKGLKKLLPEQASQVADELVAAGQAVPLAPVIEAIRKQVKRVGEIASETIMRAMAAGNA